MTGSLPAAGPGQFQILFPFPPVAQYNTNTCWSFATTSFYESEIFRLSGKKIKLSEMWTVYFEYLEKSGASCASAVTPWWPKAARAMP